MQQDNSKRQGLIPRLWRKIIPTRHNFANQKSNKTVIEDQGVKSIQMPNAIFLPAVISFFDEGHTVTIRLRGFSMRPFLEDNRDQALLRKPTNPKVYDPVLAEIEPKHFVLHRIISIDGNKVTLRGDGNLGCEHCRLEDIRAQVVGFYRKGRKKLDRTDGLKWRTYSWIWIRLFPVRRYLLAFYRRIWIPLFGPV